MNRLVNASTSPVPKCSQESCSTPRAVPLLLQEQIQSLPIPQPRWQVLQAVHRLAALVRGPVEPLRFGGGTSPAGLRLPMAGLGILGTACARPLLCDEAQELQQLIGGTMIVTRLDAVEAAGNELSFDVLVPGGKAWLEDYRLWGNPGASFWLVPAEGEGRSVALSPWGTTFICRAPFYALDERQGGFEHAARALRQLRKGR